MLTMQSLYDTRIHFIYFISSRKRKAIREIVRIWIWHQVRKLIRFEICGVIIPYNTDTVHGLLNIFLPFIHGRMNFSVNITKIWVGETWRNRCNVMVCIISFSILRMVGQDRWQCWQDRFSCQIQREED